MIHPDLGYTYKDKITGFTGVAVARVEYLTGCIHLCLETGDKDNKSTSDYFDENRLVRTKKAQITYDRPANTRSPGATPRAQHQHP
jgi:hypothetical protein